MACAANSHPQISQFQTFSNIYELKLFIHNLQIATGTKYRIEKVDYFSRFTEQYDRFMYKKVIYRCCGFSQSEPCFSFVVVEAVGLYLQIIDCDSRHTHDGKTMPRALPSVIFVGVSALDPDPEFTKTFKNFFDGVAFQNFDELQEQFNRFFEITGASYIRRHTTKLPVTHADYKTCVYRRLTLECKHSGTCKSRSTHGIARKSKMINCPSRLNFIYENGYLKILNYNLRHNHLLSPAAIPRDETPKIASKRRFQLRPLSDDSDQLDNDRNTSVPTRSYARTLWCARSSEDSTYVDPFLGNASTSTEQFPSKEQSRLRELMSGRKNSGTSI